MQRITAIGVIAVILTTACGCGLGAGGAPGQVSADKHAAAAGVAMVNVSQLAIPTSTAVQSVIGRGSDDSIEALQADGTVYSGTVVLRITVDAEPTFTQCYRYAFRHSTDDLAPHRVDCHVGATPVLLPTLTPQDLDDPVVKAKLLSVLSALTPAQRSNSDAVTTLVEQSFGPPALVSSSVDSTGIGVRINEGGSALPRAWWATVRRSTHYAHGPDCQGG